MLKVMDDLYRQNILDHFKNPRNYGKLDNPDIEADEENISCGDRIGMGIKIKYQKSNIKYIEEIKFHGEGCAITMASASLLTEKVKGKNLEDAKKIGKDEIMKMLGVTLTPTRMKCALLPLEVLQKTLLQIETGKNNKKIGT